MAITLYFARADAGPWRSHLNAILDEGKEAASHAAFAFVDCALAERDRKMADQALTIIPAEGAENWPDNSLWPRDWYVGLVARSFGDSSGAQSAFTTARDVAKTLQGQPEYAPAWSLLGMIDAGLGAAKPRRSQRVNGPVNCFQFPKTPRTGRFMSLTSP